MKDYSTVDVDYYDQTLEKLGIARMTMTTDDDDDDKTERQRCKHI